MSNLNYFRPARSVISVIAGLILCAASSTYAAVDVVTTVRPLAFIAQAIVGQHGQAQSIMDAQDSPHHFTLTPSDRLQIADSEMMVWVGPILETELADFLFDQERSRTVIRAASLPTMTIASLASGETDPHIWLSPDNATVIARAISKELSALQPELAADFEANLQNFVAAVEAATAMHRDELQGLSTRSFMVYHDAYQYFEEYFSLRHSLALVDNPEVEPGMRALLSKREQIADLQPDCLLLEPDSREPLVATLIPDRSHLRVVTIDPLGYGIAISAAAYPELIESVAGAFTGCLSPAEMN